MKNDLTCGVVRDLLPSYVEGLTSPESNTAVERHLSECPDCAQLRTALAGAPEQAAPEDAKEVDYLKKVKRRGWRRVIAAVAVTALLFAVGVAAKLFVIGEPANLGLLGESQLDDSHKCAGAAGSCISIPNGLILPTVTGNGGRTKTASFMSAARQTLPSFLHAYFRPLPEHIFDMDGVRRSLGGRSTDLAGWCRDLAADRQNLSGPNASMWGTPPPWDRYSVPGDSTGCGRLHHRTANLLPQPYRLTLNFSAPHTPPVE